MNALRRWVLTGLVVPLLCAAPPTFAAEAPVSSSIPYKRDAAASEVGISRVVIALLICGVAGAGAILYLRRRLGTTISASIRHRHMQVLESQRLNAQLALYVVEFSGKRYLLAHSNQGVSCIASSSSTSGEVPEQAV